MNRRLINIAIFSLLVAMGITYFIFHAVKKAAEPEPTELIAYFKYNIDKDTILKESDVTFISTPKSLVPKTAIKTASEVKGKRLIIKAEAGDMVLSGKLVERGDIREDVSKLWTIGLDVTNISNFLGGNLKEGGEYILLYKDTAGTVTILSDVKIANMVDSTGKLITSSGDGLIKTVNVAVKDRETMLNIAAMKNVGSFELVDAPEGYKIVKEDEPVKKVDDAGGAS
jgi:hypothetical protein